MWVMTTTGFYSTVLTDDGRAMVRGRDRGDLERFVSATGGEAALKETPHADYPYRVIVEPEVWAEFLRRQAEAIDYRNFKDAVTRRQGRDRHDVYLRVWTALRGIESPRRRMSDPGARVEP
ncbi:MAG: hypothetical protein ACKO8G_06730 [Actinomycetota bacterium]